MASRYKLIIKTPAGAHLAEVSLDRGPVRRIEIDKSINVPSTCRVEMDGRSSVKDLFTLDCQVEVWRRNKATVPPTIWYLEFAGLHVDEERSLEGGRWTFVSTSYGYLELLTRRELAWFAGTDQATKSGPAETVMKQFVDENAGPAATEALGRMSEGTTPGLSIGADTASGATWSGSRAHRELLEVVREIGAFSGIDIDIIPIAGGFEFHAYPNQLGADRSLPVVDLSTGRNAAGNIPVVFAPELGNVDNVIYSKNHSEEKNSIIVLGKGDLAQRAFRVREDTTAIAASLFNRRELIINASNLDSDNELDAAGDEALSQYAVKEELELDVLQLPYCAYGKHYFLGDVVSAQFQGLTFAKKIARVKIALDEDGEALSVILEDR